MSKPKPVNDRLREALNPLRGFTASRAVNMFEWSTQGQHAEPQWMFHNMERTYPTLAALIERRTSAIVELDWSVNPLAEEEWPPGITEAQVIAQVEVLKAAYSRIDNFAEGMEAMAMASFRGFCLIEKQDIDGDGLVDHFGITDTWNWIQDGGNGSWYWNPDANLSVYSLHGQTPIDESLFVIRKVARPIDILALPLFCRAALGEKDWSTFLEIFSVPGGVVVGPPAVPSALEQEYADSGKKIAEGGVGYLPNGSEWKPNNPPHEGAPFENFLRYQHEQLVLAGTGGQLTMLAESGSGTLAGNAHSETFKSIARSEGTKISDIFQAQFDKPLLAQMFPGQPVLAYFALDVKQSPTTREVITDVKDLSAAGYKVRAEEIEERTGYELEESGVMDTIDNPNDVEDGQVPNSATDVVAVENRRGRVVANRSSDMVDAVARAVAKDLLPIRKALLQIMEMKDRKQQASAMRSFLATAPMQARDILAQPESAEALADAMATSYVNGLAKAKRKTKT